LGVYAIFLSMGVGAVKGAKDVRSLWQLGFGAISPQALINWYGRVLSAGAAGLIANVLIANIPQSILSFIYFTYNSLYTCMLAAYEWSQFSSNRKGLCISGIPQGSQRSTYFLSLPYRFAIPIMILSTALNWLVTQSIFLVAAETYQDGKPKRYLKPLQRSMEPDLLTCSYSPVAIFSVIILGIFMMVFSIGMGQRPGIQLAGSCSAAIAAACHLGAEEERAGAAFEPLQWSFTSAATRDSNEVGHCAISNKEVAFPIEGCMYAGYAGQKLSR
jgi:hypothetical protein